MAQDKLDNKIPWRFLFRRYTCGVCKDGVKLQIVWEFEHETQGGYGSVDHIVSYVCRRCAPTREQLIFMSLSFDRDMPKYKYTKHYM